MANLTSVLAQIKQNESQGNYTAQNPNSTASGAYQFVNGTWQSLTKQSGIGTQYTTAGSAPPGVQDAIASYALMQNPNANSCSLWGTCDAAGNVIGPARYPTVDNYDITPTQLLVAANGGSLAAAGPAVQEGSGGAGGTGQGFTPVIDTGGPGDPNAQPGEFGSDLIATGSGPNIGSALSNVPVVGGLLGGLFGGGGGGTGAGQPGYLPPAATGGPAALGLTPGLAGGINSWITGAETAVGNAFRAAYSATLGSVQNYVVRFFLLLAGLVVLAVALWKIVNPGVDLKDLTGALKAAR
jgi:resuscitation-promoting factor RpfA